MKLPKLVFSIYVAAVIFAALATSARAHSFKAPKHMSLDQRAAFQKKVLRHDRHVLRWYRRHRPLRRLPTCTMVEDLFKPPRRCLTPTARERALRSRLFHKAQARWTSKELRETMLAIVRRADASWSRALDYVELVFPQQRPWVQSCSSSEGASPDGLRAERLRMNREGSGAGGPMQFMAGTFYSNVDGAAAETRRRGHRFLAGWRRWSSYAGQALTAAWMRWRGTDRGQWTGASC